MLTLQITDFNHRKAKIRTRVGGLYHPILHMHPDDMVAVGVKCGGTVLVQASAHHNARPTSFGTTANPNPTTVAAVAWPQKGAQRGQARFSRLLRRCLVHGQAMDANDLLKYVHVTTHTTRNNHHPTHPNHPNHTMPRAQHVTIAMSATTREHLSSSSPRQGGTDFPTHLELYFQQALVGRIVTPGTGFNCPVLGISHTFWIRSVTRVKEDPSGEHKEHTTSANQGPVVQYAKVHPTTQVRLCHDDQEDEITRFQTTAVSPEASSTTSAATSAATVVASFDQIGGLQNEIATVRGMIEKPLHAPELFVQLGLAPPKGILMFGPPGTGKTMIARAVAVSSRATFLSINGSELLSDVVGASETALRNIFQQALERQPTVIFIDEIDALCPKRESSADVDKRMVSTILTLMDGVNDGGNDDGGGGGGGGGGKLTCVDNYICGQWNSSEWTLLTNSHC